MGKRKRLWDRWEILEVKIKNFKTILQNELVIDENHLVDRKLIDEELKKLNVEICDFIKEVEVVKNKTNKFMRKEIDRVFNSYTLAEREGKRALEEYDREMNRMPDVLDCEL
jgi:hypothetical protein